MNLNLAKLAADLADYRARTHLDTAQWKRMRRLAKILKVTL